MSMTLIYSNEHDEETMKQNKKNKIMKKLNDHLDEIIEKSKSKNLDEYQFLNDFGDKELKFKIFKLNLADLSNEIDEKLFEQIFGHTIETLANKLINTTSKEENQIIVKNIDKNKEKIHNKDELYNFAIQPQQRADLRYTIDFILDFNETIQLDLA